MSAEKSKYLEKVQAQELVDEVKARLATKLDKGKGVYQAGGNKIFSNLPAAAQNTLGFVYNVTDDFETTADFVEGAGIKCAGGTDVSVIAIPGANESDPVTYKYNLFGGSGVIESITSAELETMWKDPGVLTLTNSDDSAFTPSTDTVSATVSGSVVLKIAEATGVVTATSSDDEIATATVSGETITIAGVAAGNAVITVVSTESTNNRKATAAVNVTVS